MTAKRRKPERPGLPSPDSVREEKTFVTPRGTKYRILRTDEVDGYEEEKPPKRKRKT